MGLGLETPNDKKAPPNISKPITLAGLRMLNAEYRIHNWVKQLSHDSRWLFELVSSYSYVFDRLDGKNDTRWACKYINIAILMEHLDIVIDMTEYVHHTGNSNSKVHARGLLSQVQIAVHFVACFVIFNQYCCYLTAWQRLSIAESGKLIGI